ncbi:hypothetical protein D3C75_1275360 [compost metagenome]
MVFPFIYNDLFVNNRIQDILAQTKGDPAAAACGDKTILRTRVESILTIDKLGM